ncbi:MAG: PSD1 and planctomycete cytochrome C domain-containing protein [Planctomycetota bacterium]
MRSPERFIQSIPLFIAALLIGSWLLAGCSEDAEVSALPGDPLPETVGFNEHIRPILASNCAACHGGVKKSGGLSFVFRDEAIAQGDSGNMSIVPGDVAASYLVEKITSDDPLIRMPPPDHGPALSEQQVALVKKWIEQGADWEEHWAFVKPEAPEVPEFEDDSWSRNAIDRFVLAKLREEGLSPSEEAGKGELLRRVTLDLTGLPPTIEELDAFLADDSEDAYDKVVDRLLESPRFGERWATLWLDLARYADSKGLGRDRRRDTIYMYRDWVIRAFNADMSFDEFTIKQIAGDLLPDATLDDHLATAFHRNSPAEDEGGTDDEEFRVVALMDRVNTTWQVWHGTTMACVQCHSHPYDPIRHDEYFTFMDFLNNTQDGDLFDDRPKMKFPASVDQLEQKGALVSWVREKQRELWSVPAELNQQTPWQWLSGTSSQTNRAEQITYHFETRNDREEFYFEGTPAHIYQKLTSPLPAMEAPLQAIRLDVLPIDMEAAPHKPSPGFEIQKLSATLVRSNGTEQALPFDRIDLDEPFPMGWINVKEGRGFTALNHIFHDRWSVYRLAEPVEIVEGDQLRLEIHHGQGTARDMMLIRRGAIAVTDDTRWREFDTTEQYQTLRAEYNRENNELTRGEQIHVPVMVERPEHLRRGTKTFVRGNWTELGEPQMAGTPASFHPLPDTDEPDRLRMARWLVDEDNPLSARVLVCRFWEQLFGVGIVETLEDFGSVGLPPSHSELLDHLALELMHEFDWSMKELLRYMVTSSTYRQDNASTPELNERDPRNRLLARGPRTRLTGEMIRDQVLAVAGVLNKKMYGKPVMPEIPEGGWNPSHPGGGSWNQSGEDASNRRSIYVHWQRSSTYPVFEAFDAPSRDLVTDRRITSNTPVQPLFTLNDPALFKATQRFARRIQEHPGTLEERLAHGYRMVMSTDASQAVLAELVKLYQQTESLYPEQEATLKAAWDQHIQAVYNKKGGAQVWRNNQAIKKAEQKNEEPPTDLPDPELIQPGPEDAYDYDAQRSAYDAVASVLLNLDSALNK